MFVNFCYTKYGLNKNRAVDVCFKCELHYSVIFGVKKLHRCIDPVHVSMQEVM